MQAPLIVIHHLEDRNCENMKGVYYPVGDHSKRAPLAQKCWKNNSNYVIHFQHQRLDLHRISNYWFVHGWYISNLNAQANARRPASKIAVQVINHFPIPPTEGWKLYSYYEGEKSVGIEMELIYRDDFELLMDEILVKRFGKRDVAEAITDFLPTFYVFNNSKELTCTNPCAIA